MRKNKKSFISVILLLLLFIGIGYAFLTTDFEIDGTAGLRGNTWNVHWENVRVAFATSGVTGITANNPTLTSPTSLQFDLGFSEPGDYVIILVDVVNSGTIDAMVDDIDYNDYLPYYVRVVGGYLDGLAVTKYQKIPANTTETYRIIIAYDKYISEDQLSSDDHSVTLTYGVNYKQADIKAVPKTRTFYTASDSNETDINFDVGATFRTPEGTFPTAEGALQSWGNNMFLKHILAGNIINENILGVQINSNIIYLKAGDATYDIGDDQYINDSQYYSENVTTLNGIGCDCSNNLTYCDCTITGWKFVITKTGNVSAQNTTTNFQCGVSESGTGICYSLD